MVWLGGRFKCHLCLVDLAGVWHKQPWSPGLVTVHWPSGVLRGARWEAEDSDHSGLMLQGWDTPLTTEVVAAVQFSVGG